MHMESKVFFVLVNYNGITDTIDCIKSINNLITYSRYEIIVVDNSPTIEPYNELKRRNMDKTILVRSEKNDGFAAACNLGILQAEKLGYDYVILLNNDTIIKTPDIIEQLILCFSQIEDVGISGGKIYYYDHPDDCWYAAGYLTPFRLKAKNRIKIDGICETPFITGCMQMLSRKAIKTVGLMSEKYFMFYEDADYCEKMHRAGFKTVYNSAAQVYHKVSKSISPSSPASIYSSNRSRYLYIKKYHNLFFEKMFYWCELTIKLLLYENEKKQAIKDVIKFILNERQEKNIEEIDISDEF